MKESLFEKSLEWPPRGRGVKDEARRKGVTGHLVAHCLQGRKGGETDGKFTKGQREEKH